MIYLAGAFTACYVFWWFMGIVGFLKILNVLPSNAIICKYIYLLFFKYLLKVGLLLYTISDKDEDRVDTMLPLQEMCYFNGFK